MMGISDSFLVSPGALFMFLVVLAFGLGIFSWSANFLKNSGNKSMHEGRTSVDCSNMGIDIIQQDFNGTYYTVFLQVNKPTDALAVVLDSKSSNTTKVFHSPDPGQVLKVSAESNSSMDVKAYFEGCAKPYTP